MIRETLSHIMRINVQFILLKNYKRWINVMFLDYLNNLRVLMQSNGMIIEGGEASSSRPPLNLLLYRGMELMWKVDQSFPETFCCRYCCTLGLYTTYWKQIFSYFFQSQKFNIWSFSSINGWINIYLFRSVLYQSLWRHKYSVLFCDLQKILNAPTKVICYRIIINDFLKTPNYLRQNQRNSLCLRIVCFHCK